VGHRRLQPDLRRPLVLGGRAGDVFGDVECSSSDSRFHGRITSGGMATTSTMLLLTRAVQGVGAALAAPSTLSLISATFEEGSARNKALGICHRRLRWRRIPWTYLGWRVDVVVSWRWVMFINVPIGIAIILWPHASYQSPAQWWTPRRGGRGVVVTGGPPGQLFRSYASSGSYG